MVKGTPAQLLRAGVEGGLLGGGGVGGASGPVFPTPTPPGPACSAHYSFLVMVTGAECGQGTPGPEAPAAGGLTNGD